MTFSWWTFLFEVLNFVVLAYILQRLLYRPLREAIEKRRDANARAQAEALHAHQEAEALQQQLRARLAAAEQEGQDIIHQARSQAELERKKLLAQGEQEAQRRQHELHHTLARERDQALKAVHEEVVAQAIELTGRLLEGAAERTLHQQLVLRLVRDLEMLPEAERDTLRHSWRPHDAAVLESAEALTPATLESLTAAVGAVVGQPVTLTVCIRPELLGGIRLRLAGNVWDSSLAGQMVGIVQGREGVP